MKKDEFMRLCDKFKQPTLEIGVVVNLWDSNSSFMATRVEVGQGYADYQQATRWLVEWWDKQKQPTSRNQKRRFEATKERREISVASCVIGREYEVRLTGEDKTRSTTYQGEGWFETLIGTRYKTLISEIYEIERS